MLILAKYKRIQSHRCGQNNRQCISKCWFMTFWVEQAVISTFVHQFNEFAIHELIQFLYLIFEANV